MTLSHDGHRRAVTAAFAGHMVKRGHVVEPHRGPVSVENVIKAFNPCAPAVRCRRLERDRGGESV